MARYNLALLRYGQLLLVQKRCKAPYENLYNGLGGKYQEQETLVSGMQREIFEETGLTTGQYQLFNCGYINWQIQGKFKARIDLFLGQINPAVQLPPYPQSTFEGQLELISPKALLSLSEQEVVPDFLKIVPIMNRQTKYQVTTNYENEKLIDFKKVQIDD